MSLYIYKRFSSLVVTSSALSSISLIVHSFLHRHHTRTTHILQPAIEHVNMASQGTVSDQQGSLLTYQDHSNQDVHPITSTDSVMKRSPILAIPHELLSEILAPIPWTRKQHASLKIVNKKFNETVKSSYFRRQVRESNS